MPYPTWLREGWSSGRRDRPAGEVLFAVIIPVRAPYLIAYDQVSPGQREHR